MKNYTVYMHISPKGKRYIGITCKKPEYRWNNGRGYKPNKHFFSAIEKYGWNNFKHTIIASELTKEEACSIEQELIKKYDTTNVNRGYNQSLGGESGALGVKRSAECIKKYLASREYKSSWAKGKHFTKEHRQKIAEANRGKKMSEEAKQKMRIAKVGYKPVWTGQKRDNKYRAAKSKPVICIETKTRYFGLMEAERQTGVSHANISNCLKGKRERAGGFHWKYASKTF